MSFRLLISLFFVVGALFTGVATADDFKKVQQGPMTLQWKVTGDKLEAKLSAKTDGWVSLGFGKTKKMKGADIVIGFVKGDKASIAEHYAISDSRHEKKKGEANLENASVSLKDGVTEINFTRTLKAKSEKESVTLDPKSDSTIVMIAYGNRASFSKKHDGLVVMEVNLSTGATKNVTKVQ